MIKDLLDNLANELQNEENTAKVNMALDPWLFKLKLSFYVVITLQFLIFAIVCIHFFYNTRYQFIVPSLKITTD